MQTMLESLPDVHQQRLSSGAGNLLKIAHDWKQTQAGLASADVERWKLKQLSAAGQNPQVDSSVSPINNPATDFLYSPLSGFTQSETSTAWCGDHVVTGFNDSGSIFESLAVPNIGLSFSGASYSTDKGHSFQDAGFINPGPSIFNFLGGDPVVTCVAGSRGSVPVFFFSQIFATGPSNAPVSGIVLSRSTNGGAAWENPVTAVQKDGLQHFLDKDWNAIDSRDPNRIFITYTDFDTSGIKCGFGSSGQPNQRTAIEVVESVDSGLTWTAPLVLTEGCFTASANFLSVQGSQVIFDPAGNVYVAWESFTGPSQVTRAAWISKSTDHGKTFQPAVRISNVTLTGNGNALQGGIRNNEFPLLAVDPQSGTLYAVWNDGRNFFVTDETSPDGRYHFADVLISKSTNGQTWSAPVRVNQDSVSHLRNGQPYGTDHYQPGVAVDKSGTVGVCWYDRRNDPNNFALGRFCAFSTDGGSSWHESSSLPANWQPFHDVDFLIAQYYLGDYDNVASDTAQNNNGFFGAFAFVSTSAPVPNQDVGIINFP
jgi:hypothetical protein